MKTPEDEAFDELAKQQGAWGGGFKAKQAMAADKLEDDPLAELDGILERLAAGNYTITKYKGTYDVGYMMYARDILAAEKEKNMECAADKLLEEATRSCNNIDEQRALDALMREAQPAQEPVREALKLAVDGLERMLGSFEADGKVVMKSMVRNELFAEMHLLLKRAKKVLAQPAKEKNNGT